MKCTLSASALLVALASLFPVAAAETPATNHQVEAVAQFNEYLNAGEIEQAEALAKECFLKNSSDPVAVLMLRQAFLARKGHPQQVVFPGRLTRSKVIATQQPADTADALQESGVVARSAKTAVVRS